MHSKLMIVKVKAINYVQEGEGKIRDFVGGFFKGATYHNLVMMGYRLKGMKGLDYRINHNSNTM